MISRSSTGELIPELGAGGGGGDLVQFHNYLEIPQDTVADQLVDLCTRKFKDSLTRSKIVDMIRKATLSNAKAISLHSGDLPRLEGDLSLDRLLDSMANIAKTETRCIDQLVTEATHRRPGNARVDLPSRIVRSDELLPSRIRANAISNFLIQGTLPMRNFVIWWKPFDHMKFIPALWTTRLGHGMSAWQISSAIFVPDITSATTRK